MVLRSVVADRPNVQVVEADAMRLVVVSIVVAMGALALSEMLSRRVAARVAGR